MKDQKISSNEILEREALKELLKHAERDIASGRTLSSEELRASLKKLVNQHQN
ncbi:hypothetical protein IG537_15640 [Vibrio cholerae]|uniref:hypothetical protein n=1 Tax=Vibrio cholerae TaxID=666 RepID=UPI00226ECDC9|nr:hypothetical protein [Vibrio cholerae]MCX9592896.1 hypothetical protein [Vibrio cholerae]